MRYGKAFPHQHGRTIYQRLMNRACMLAIAYTLVAGTLVGCQSAPSGPASVEPRTVTVHTPTPTHTATPVPAQRELFYTYAQGELLPDMRVPLERSETGEGGWYTIVGTEEGWSKFLSQMGQPAEIWEPVSWGEEILIGAMLGVRGSRECKITITDLDINGVTVSTTIAFTKPSPDQVPSPWPTYPFHFVRVSRTELPLGPVDFRFVAAQSNTSGAQELARQSADMIDLDILWLSGEKATYPTPTSPPSTSTPVPTLTPTPVPHLQVIGTVLEVMTDTLTVRIVPNEGNWEYVELMEATSILMQDGQPATLAQLLPGTAIGVLGYTGEAESFRAAHIDVLSLPNNDHSFAPYRPRAVTLSTIYDGYDLPLSVENISATLPLSQTLTPSQTQVLTQYGFVVVPAAYDTFASLYNDPEQDRYPVFISTDSVLNVTQLLYKRALQSTEQMYLAPDLEMLDRELFELSWAQYQEVQASTTPAEQRMAETALRNAAYFAVPLSLLDPEFTPPDVLTQVVQAELSLISESRETTISPLFNLPGVPQEEKLRIDYGQFKPSGHYRFCAECAPGTDLSRYFQAITWHRQVAFRISQREETRSAVLIAHTIHNHAAPRVLWDRLHAPLSFLQGQESSLTLLDYGPVVDDIWGEDMDSTALADETKMDAFVKDIRDLPLPDNAMWKWIWEAEGYPERDWRLFSQPFAIDTYVFQQMTGENVGDQQNRRTLPSCIDLAAVLGSLEAYRVASQAGEFQYTDYMEQIGKVRNELAALQTAHWTESLHWNWLYTYRALLEEKSLSYPYWMRTFEWKRKELQTMFGSWTDIQHDAWPDTGPVSTSTPAQESLDMPWGYIEPQPEVYARLAALTRSIIDGLESRFMFTTSRADVRDDLLKLEEWLIFFQDVARRELTGQILSTAEYQQLAAYGSLLNELSLQDSQAAGIVRISTTQENQLYEAIGPMDEIYVVIERDREQYLARGGVYAHYQLVWPAEQTLTDDVWQQIIASDQMPARPDWVLGFTGEKP